MMNKNRCRLSIDVSGVQGEHLMLCRGDCYESYKNDSETGRSDETWRISLAMIKVLAIYSSAFWEQNHHVNALFSLEWQNLQKQNLGDMNLTLRKHSFWFQIIAYHCLENEENKRQIQWMWQVALAKSCKRFTWITYVLILSQIDLHGFLSTCWTFFVYNLIKKLLMHHVSYKVLWIYAMALCFIIYTAYSTTVRLPLNCRC